MELENQRLRANRSEETGYLQKEISKRDLKIAALQEQLDEANKQLAWFFKEIFDQTTDKNSVKDKLVNGPPDAEGEAPKGAKEGCQRPRAQRSF